MKTSTRHTPVPWKEDEFHGLADKDGGAICWYTTDDDGVHFENGDAAFIVKCVNAHEELLKAAKEVYALAIGPINERARGPMERLYKAITKAEGRNE